MNWANRFLVKIFERAKKLSQKKIYDEYRALHDLPESFRFNGPDILVSPEGKLTVGQGTYVGGYSMILPKQDSPVVIGKYCSISHFVSIYTSNVDAAQDLSMPSDGWKMRSGTVRIGDYCWIGLGVTILEGVTIGDNVVIGAHSLVTSDLPSNGIYGGIPAKLIKSKAPIGRIAAKV